MNALWPVTRTLLLVCLTGIVLILCGCGYRVTKEAPDVLLQTPKTSYLTSSGQKQVTAGQLIRDCSATTAQLHSLQEWAR